MALNLGKTDVTVSSVSETKQPMGNICWGDILTENVRPSNVVATPPAPAAESEATVADITSNPIFSATSSPHPDRVMSRLSTSQRAVAISSRIIALDLTQGGSAVGQVVLGYRNLGHRGLAQPKNSIHL